MNIHNTINLIISDISALTNKEALVYFTKTLNSYSVQINNGIGQLEAFNNAVHAPTRKVNVQKQQEQEHIKKIAKNKKYRTLARYQDIVVEQRAISVSYEKIAKYLNSHKIMRQDFTFNRQYIYEFCKNRGIS
ncbi:MAG: hypothetical protein DRG78_02580 [Epsilonproteobacteria bacterium]|nr:MAG: hypothetical protein DRG78_02580 [Campylobacterota bacterium]